MHVARLRQIVIKGEVEVEHGVFLLVLEIPG